MIDTFAFLAHEPKITKQWDIPRYQTPWEVSEKTDTRNERKENGIINKPNLPYKVYAYDTETKETVEYKTLSECCRIVDSHKDTLRTIVASGKIYRNRYFFSRSMDGLRKAIHENKGGLNQSRGVKLLDTVTDEVVDYPSISKVRTEFNVCRAVIVVGNLIAHRYRVMEVTK